MTDRAVYTVSGGLARWGYPQAQITGNLNVYAGLLTLSDHLRTLAALHWIRPLTGRFLTRFLALSGGSGKGHETHIPAQQDQARPHARFSRTHGNEGRPSRPEAPSRKRSCPPYAIVRTAINRFGKDQRLLNAADFGRVFDRATRSRDKLFTVLCRRNSTDAARLGLAISKKHCRRATARNRIKRIIRESFRQHQDQLSGLDIVVINQAGASQASNPQLFDSLDRHWQRCTRTKSEGPKTNG